MAIHKLQVFLASRFDEFKELRASLRGKIDGLKVPSVEAIDLNDNAANPFPPLRRCYEAIDQAELFVLLVGNEYGTKLDSHRASYTHLEYKHALGESKPILPFLIGPTHNKDFNSDDYHDDDLAEWVDEIRKHQTPSYLEHDTDDQAGQIFNEVLARLVELFVEVGEGEPEVDDDLDKGWEDSPIKLDQLAKAPTISTDRPISNQPLKILAADHAKEALAALKLHLPQIAIQHLTQASELAPLDIIVGYWLARLLIASGRREHCKKGRQVALRCARIASTAESHPNLETMACKVLAARASERLGEMDLALQYAEDAHKGMEHHWMAKLEYGRQLAFAKDNAAALKMAKEAFWLRPLIIRQIQNDSAYRGLGRVFTDFRARLRRDVESETESIDRIESKIREFETELGMRETEVLDDTAVSVITSPTLMSPEASIAELFQRFQAETPRDVKSVESRSLLQLVNDGHLSAKRSLEMLQRCAKQLAKDIFSFEFDGQNGFTPMVKQRIVQKIELTKDEIRILTSKLDEAREQGETLDEAMGRFKRLSLLVGGVFITLIIASYLTDYPWIGLTVILAGGLAGWLGYATRTKLKTGISEVIIETKDLREELTEAQRVLAKVKNELRVFEREQLTVRAHIDSFCDLIVGFESVALRRVRFSPVPPIYRKEEYELVRIDPAKASELEMKVDDQLLPADLRYLIETSESKSKYWVGRRIKSDATDIWSRSAAYFQ